MISHYKKLLILLTVWISGIPALTLMCTFNAFSQSDRILEKSIKSPVLLPLQGTLADSSASRISPKGAMYRSLIFPGWGQWYNGKKIKSAVIFTAETACIGGYFYERHRLRNSSVEYEREFYREERDKYVWWLSGVVLYGMIDAFVDAYMKDFDADMDINIGQGNSGTLFTINVAISSNRLFHRRR